MALVNPRSRPLGFLIAIFCAWKAFLLLIAIGASVGPDYDTSTSIFFDRVYGAPPASPVLAQRLTRWDALYFVHAARVGKLYEQEWAFGVGLSGLVSHLARLLPGARLEPLLAIAVANLSHLLAVLVLYRLTFLIAADGSLALVAAVLHIISPAGLFLSAPYAESTYAFLTFAGYLAFACSFTGRRGLALRGCCVIGAGALFALATVFRSNGLGNGLLFAVEAVRCLGLFSRTPGVYSVVPLLSAVFGGLLVAAGFIAPQAAAWARYCGESPVRPWCTRTLPSIYAFVQDHYWDVGFLRYWTLNQVPLFVLATPVLGLLIASGAQVLREPSCSLPLLAPGNREYTRTFVRTLAATQVFVALLAITNYHVQIINRLASGYVIWYWWIAGLLLQREGSALASAVVMFFVMYAGIQASLFASFLPPA